MEIQNALPVKLSHTVADRAPWRVFAQLLCLFCLLAFSNAWGQFSCTTQQIDACNTPLNASFNFADCSCTCAPGYVGSPECIQEDPNRQCPIPGFTSCLENEQVIYDGDFDFYCAACPDGTTNEACDNLYFSSDGAPRVRPEGYGPDVITQCDATPSVCAEDEYVSSGSCQACPDGTVNPAGDDPLGDDTSCALVIECVGFEAPMDHYPVRVKKNRALPLKGELFSVNEGFAQTDADLVAPPLVQVVFDNSSEAVQDVTDDAVSAGQGSEGNLFVFTDDGKWQFNLKTHSYTAPGTYTVYMESGDDREYVIDPTCETQFTVR